MMPVLFRRRARAMLSFAIGALVVSTVAACSLLVPLSDYDADPVDGATDASTMADGDATSTKDAAPEAAPASDAQPPPLSAYAELVLTDQPLLYVRLDDTNATAPPTSLVLDGGRASLGAYNATAVELGKAGAIVGDPDTAVHLTGNLDGQHYAISLGSDMRYSLDGPTSYSLEIWALPDRAQQIAGSYGRFFSHDEGFDSGRQAVTGGFIGDQLFAERIVAGDVSNDVYTDSLPALDAAAPLAWLHCVVTYDASTHQLLLYANGAVVGLATTNGGALDFEQATDLLLGGEPGNGGTGDKVTIYSGELDEFALYAQVLDGGTIARHYQVGAGLSSP